MLETTSWSDVVTSLLVQLDRLNAWSRENLARYSQKANMAPHFKFLEPRDRFLVLGLEPGSPATAIREEKKHIALRLHPDKLPTTIAPELRAQCAKEYIVCQDAWTYLLESQGPRYFVEVPPIYVAESQAFLEKSYDSATPQPRGWRDRENKQ